MHDLRLALRSLRANPIVSTLAVLSLALGVGANTAIFSLIDGLLLRPLPVRDPASLALVSDTTAPGARSYGYAVWTAFEAALAQRADIFEGVCAWAPERFALNRRGDVQSVDGAWVSGSFFEMLGVASAMGRMLTPADDRAGGGPNGPAAVISYGFWQRRFAGAADTIGRTLSLDDTSFTIVGVMPPDFTGTDVGRAADVIVPLGTEPIVRGRESAIAPGGRGCCLGLTIMARLTPGRTIDAATIALRGLQPQVREATLPHDPRYRQQDLDGYLRDPFTLLPGAAGSSRLRLRYERPLLALMVVAALVLLIACANIANLLLARVASRQHELYIRLALGASRWRLVRLLMAESAVIAGIGAALGVLMASWASALLVRQLSTPAAPVALDLSLDWRLLAFASGVTVLVTLVAGIVPGLRTVRMTGSDAAGDGARIGAGPGFAAWNGGGAATGAGGAILVAQVALSVVLVVAAGLFLRTFLSLVRLPLGFDPDRVLMVTVSAERAQVPPDRRPALFDRTRDAVRALPGVSEAALSFLTPVSGPILLRPIDAADGVPLTLPERERLSAVNLVSPGWFRTLGTPIVSGRDFNDRDGAGAPAVAIVNHTFVRKLLRGRAADAAPGSTLSIGIVGPNAASVAVIGVVADAAYASLREPVPSTIYFPLAQLQMMRTPLSSLTLSVRADRGSPLLLANGVTRAIGEVDPDLAIAFRALADQITASIAQERIVAMLSGFFGGLALLLAGLGLFGVTAHAVSRRRREIGIRVALGAAPARVVRLVLARVLLLVGLGVAIGAGVSMWASRFVASLLFGLDARDPLTLGGAAGLLIGVGLFAAWLPARRAVAIDPAIVLRSE